jgi:hypothetical protein
MQVHWDDYFHPGRTFELVHSLGGMSLILPDWVEHHSDTDDKKKRQTIFSIHVHPDGTRLATGGIGALHERDNVSLEDIQTDLA